MEEKFYQKSEQLRERLPYISICLSLLFVYFVIKSSGKDIADIENLFFNQSSFSRAIAVTDVNGRDIQVVRELVEIKEYRNANRYSFFKYENSPGVLCVSCVQSDVAKPVDDSVVERRYFIYKFSNISNVNVLSSEQFDGVIDSLYSFKENKWTVYAVYYQYKDLEDFRASLIK